MIAIENRSQINQSLIFIFKPGLIEIVSADVAGNFSGITSIASLLIFRTSHTRFPGTALPWRGGAP